MIRVIICGILGKMGSQLLELSYQDRDIEVVAGIDREDGTLAGIPIYRDLNDCKIEVDVLVDFSDPSMAQPITAYCRRKKIALVMCTTGHDKADTERIRRLGDRVAVFQSANMSMGVALLAALVQKAAVILQNDFDIEIVERHHNRKLDAPSGTAVMLAERINAVTAGRYDLVYDRNTSRQRRSRDEIGMHSIRGGTIVGDHDVIFAGTDEIFTLSHSASSRSVFAAGALGAIRYIARQKPGLYTMDSMMRGILY